jgi:hypothetical protein
MAPVTPTTTGVPQHPIDDPGLVLLLERLRSYDCDNDNDCTNTRSSDKNKNGASDNDDSQWHQDHGILSPSSAAVDIEGLVGELERFHQWRFGEQVSIFICISSSTAIEVICNIIYHLFLTLIGLFATNVTNIFLVQD